MHHPIGIDPGDVANPLALQAEIDHALKRAQRTDGWCWGEAGITLGNLKSEVFQVHIQETACWLYSGAGMEIEIPKHDPSTLTVPYNSSYDGAETVTFVSNTLELVLIIGQCQYFRELAGVGIWSGASFVPRTQIALEVDGVPVEGAGTVGRPTANGNRRSGLADDTSAISFLHVELLLPGSHIIRLVAGQTPCENVAASGVSPSKLADILPTDGVYVGSRSLFVFRFAGGQIL